MAYLAAAATGLVCGFRKAVVVLVAREMLACVELELRLNLAVSAAVLADDGHCIRRFVSGKKRR